MIFMWTVGFNPLVWMVHTLEKHVRRGLCLCGMWWSAQGFPPIIPTPIDNVWGKSLSLNLVAPNLSPSSPSSPHFSSPHNHTRPGEQRWRFAWRRSRLCRSLQRLLQLWRLHLRSLHRNRNLRRHLWQRCSRGHRWRSKRRRECQRRGEEGKGECGHQTRACACGWRRWRRSEKEMGTESFGNGSARWGARSACPFWVGRVELVQFTSVSELGLEIRKLQRWWRTCMNLPFDFSTLNDVGFYFILLNSIALVLLAPKLFLRST